MANIIVRRIPPTVHESLKDTAAQHGLTLNDLALAALTAANGPNTSVAAIKALTERAAEIKRRQAVGSELRRLNTMIASAATEQERAALVALAREKLHDRVHPVGSSAGASAAASTVPRQGSPTRGGPAGDGATPVVPPNPGTTARSRAQRRSGTKTSRRAT